MILQGLPTIEPRPVLRGSQVRAQVRDDGGSVGGLFRQDVRDRAERDSDVRVADGQGHELLGRNEGNQPKLGGSDLRVPIYLCTTAVVAMAALAQSIRLDALWS